MKADAKEANSKKQETRDDEARIAENACSASGASRMLGRDRAMD